MNPNKPSEVKKPGKDILIILGTDWCTCVNYLLRDEKIRIGLDGVFT